MLTVRQDLSRGGAICYISKADADRNLVNIADEGRYIQQSYYAGNRIDRRTEGQAQEWSPWQWNPIQCGNYARQRAEILDYNVTDSALYVKCTPMLWDMDSHAADAVMEQWTELKGNTIKVHNKLTIGTIPDMYQAPAPNAQEIPAVYPISSLKNLYSYLGNKPFKGKRVNKIKVKELNPKTGAFWGSYPNVPEKWMAFTDDNNWGMGVYSDKAETYLAGRYKSDTDGEAESQATSYIAPCCQATLGNNSVFEYEYYIIIDTLENIRKTVYQLHSDNPHTP